MSTLAKALPLLLAFSAFSAENVTENVVTRRTVDSGVAVELTMRHVAPARASTPFREGDEVAVSVKIADEQSGAPVRGAFPTAWMSARRGQEAAATSKRCVQKVATFTTGNMFKRPDVDLNVYHVVVLNGDATISVVDPHFSFGGTRLLAMLGLPGRGEDWALANDQQLLFVTVPSANRVAVIDTLHWKVLRELEAGASPRRIVAQPDGELLWVATDSGVTALRRDGTTIAGRVDTGAGPHDVAVSADNRWVFVTNRAEGTTSVVDVRTMRKAGDVASGAAPQSVAWSPLANNAVAIGADGAITFIDPVRRHTVTMKAAPGIDRIRFSPDGRLGFIPNRTRNTVEILDAASGRIVQTADIGGQPFEVTFTNQLAYVRRVDSDVVLMLPLAELGKPGADVPAVDFPAGQKSFGAPTTPADGIVPAPGEAAVLVANAADKSIYYYREGMAAPMGTFGNSGKEPRALLVLNRTLRETKPGVYSTTVRLGRAGAYDFALLVNSPRIVACLDVPVAEDPVLEAKRRPALIIEAVSGNAVVKVGEKVALRVRVLDPVTREPRNGLHDILALVSLAPGVWQQRHLLTPAGNGEYLLEFASPEVGTYHVYLECPSAGLRFNSRNVLIVEATG